MTKKRKFDAAAFQTAKRLAEDVSGYGVTSPIWGKRLPEVMEMIEAGILLGISDVRAGNPNTAIDQFEKQVIPLITELKKRIAKQAIISSQMK